MSTSNTNRPETSLSIRCSCGGEHGPAEHASHHAEQIGNDLVERALVKALLPRAAMRRQVLGALGSSTFLSAIAAAFPLAAAKEAFAQGSGKLEKSKLAIGFVPITCATPHHGAPLGFYSR